MLGRPSDLPIDYVGYDGQPANWFEEMSQQAVFLAVTDGDELDVQAEDGVSPDGGEEER